jgi:hypothetical protein
MGQNALLEESLVEIKLGQYGIAQATSLKDPAHLANVRNYKRQVASRMLPLDRDDIARKIPDAEYHVSRKIDGEFSVLIYQEGSLITLNPGGTVRIGLTWQDEAIKFLESAGIREALIAGELYVEPEQERRSRVHDVVSVARQPKTEDELARIKFAVFDVISLDGEPVELPYQQVWEKITAIFQTGSAIHPVETVILKGHRDVEQQYQRWVEDEKAEGIVVRSETAGNFKIKPKHTLDAVVIGFTESTDDRQGMLHDLLLGVARGDGSIHVLSRVGGGFSDENRREMLSDLQDMIVASEYAEVNSDHVAYQMVEPKWVVEISCLDLIGQNTRGGPINRMVLNWRPRESCYEVVRRLPLVSVISPQFVRLREDKEFNPTDVRISQVTDLLPIPLAEVDAREMKMAESTLLERDVYTKQLRGELLVRKFLVWKTNKEGDSNEFPAFVTSYIDFSPSRKTPLVREIRVSNSESQIRGLFRQFVDENVKKGWELHSSISGGKDSSDGEIVAAKPSPEIKKPAKEPPKKKSTKKKPAQQQAATNDNQAETEATRKQSTRKTSKKHSQAKKKRKT